MGTQLFLHDISNAFEPEKAMHTYNADGNRAAGEPVTDPDEKLNMAIWLVGKHLPPGLIPLSQSHPPRLKPASNKRSTHGQCLGREGRLAYLPLSGAPFPLYFGFTLTSCFLPLPLRCFRLVFLPMFALLVESKRHYFLPLDGLSLSLIYFMLRQLLTYRLLRAYDGLSDISPLACASLRVSRFFWRYLLLSGESCLRILGSWPERPSYRASGG